MKRILNKNLWLALSIIYSSTLLYFSLIRIKAESLPVNFPNADKLFHFGAYFGLAFLWNFFYYAKKKKASAIPSLIIGVAAIGFGIIIEVLQRDLTTYRGFEWWDIVANSTGVILCHIFLVSIRSRFLTKHFYG